MPNDIIIIQADAKGRFTLSGVARADILKVDISDVDLIITTKAGGHYLLPNAGIGAMSATPQDVVFNNATISTNQLLGEVGTALYTADAIPMPSSLKLEGAQEGGEAKDNAHAKTLAQQQEVIQQLQKQLAESQHKFDEESKHHSDHEADHQAQVSALTVNTEASVEQLVAKAQHIEESLHRSDYDYVPPHQYELPPAPVASPPGVPPPISLTPIVNLFMGNVVGTTTVAGSGVTYIYGGGGAASTGSDAQLGPHDALQFSAASIAGTSGNDIIYANGPLVGNNTPATDRSHNAKEFSLSVAGYFTSLNDVEISGVPDGVTIVGATSSGGGTYILPSATVTDHQTFTIIYDMDSWRGGSNTFDLNFHISGITTRHVTFDENQSFRFQYIDVTSTAQVTDPTLVYDYRGISKQIYVLPTLAQPSIIDSGDGDDVVYGGLNADTITVGNGNDQIDAGDGDDAVYTGNGNNTVALGTGTNSLASGNGNDTVSAGDGVNTINVGAGTNSITVGDGNNAITTGAGNDTILTGNGANVIHDAGGTITITTGTGNDAITTAGGGGTIAAGDGNNTVTVNSTSGSTDTYTISTSGNGTNTITGGDDLYIVNVGTGTNNISLGNGTAGFNSQITAGAGTNTILTGNGRHTINVGAGVASITTGTGNDAITTAGGGGTIAAGDGNNTVTVNSTSGSTDTYTISTSGNGTNTITGGDDLYIVNVGTGTNNISLGNGTAGFNSQITAGAGTNTILTGNGRHTINVGAGVATITTGTGNDAITTAGGGGTIAAGDGNNTVTVNSTSGSTDTYTISTSGNGTTNVTGGDDNYTINTATGVAVISIGSGTSSITTGSSSDNITVGNGAMTIVAGSGNNVIATGNGVVSITTGTGNDTITTTGGGGVINTGAGTNSVSVTSGNYTITTGDGNDTIATGNGSSILNIGDGNDNITIGNGNNTIISGVGSGTVSDTILAGNGNNIFRLGLGSHTITAGSGTNTLDYSTISSDASTGYTIEAYLNSGFAKAWNIGHTIALMNDTLAGISNVITNNLNAIVQGSTGNNVITGGNGNDTFTGNGGNDTMYGGGGDDSLTGGAGNDLLYGDSGNNTFYTGSGGNDYLYGGSGNNSFYSQHAGVRYDGTNGANLGVGQINFVSYASSTASVNVNLLAGVGTSGYASGDAYAFTPTANVSSINRVYGSIYNDTITDSSGNETIYGGNGDDTLNTYNGNDTLYGENNNDTFNSLGTGIKTLDGGSGTNNYYLGRATDFVRTTAGAYDSIRYNLSGSGVLVNLDSVSHSVINSLGATRTIAASSGNGWGVTVADASSYALGDNYTQDGIDLIWGSGSNDVVFGSNTNLDFDGNSGVDYFFGGNGNDLIRMTDNDRLDGGGGVDLFYVNTNNNTTIYLDGSADINGNSIADSIDRGVSTLTIAAGSSPTGVAITYQGFGLGYSGTDYLSNIENILGAGGNDILVGNSSGNQINAQQGSNAIYGLGGNDIIYCTVGNNTIDGGIGTDSVNFDNNWYSSAATGVQVFLANATFTGASDKATYWGNGLDIFQSRTGPTGAYSYSTITNVEDINGSNNDDVLYGDSFANTITGNNGNDVLAGNGGADTLNGGNGNDTFRVTSTDLANVILFSGGAGTDTVTAAGASQSAGGISNANFSSIETFDVRNSIAGGSYSMNANDITGLADNGTASSITFKLDSGDTFTASVGSGTGALTALVASSTATDTIYYFYSDAGHTLLNATNRVAILDVHYGAG